jgi:hypothetical protein
VPSATAVLAGLRALVSVIYTIVVEEAVIKPRLLRLKAPQAAAARLVKTATAETVLITPVVHILALLAVARIILTAHGKFLLIG